MFSAQPWIQLHPLHSDPAFSMFSIWRAWVWDRKQTLSAWQVALAPWSRISLLCGVCPGYKILWTAQCFGSTLLFTEAEDMEAAAWLIYIISRALWESRTWIQDTNGIQPQANSMEGLLVPPKWSQLSLRKMALVDRAGLGRLAEMLESSGCHCTRRLWQILPDHP